MSTTKPIKDKTDLEAIKNYYLDKKEYRNYTLIIIGLNTALRISDILSLTWKDVYHYKKNCFHNHIYLTEKKTGKRTVIALNQSVIEALKTLLASDFYQDKLPKPDEYIFIGRKNTGMPINRVQAYRIIKEAATAAFSAVVRKLDRAAARGLIHKNCAAHKKSQFAKALANM